MIKISERIYSLRKSEHLTQTKFGELFNIAKTTVSSYERGNSVPDDELKIKICNHFNVSLDYLVGLTDIKHPVLYDTIHCDKLITHHEETVIAAYRNNPGMQAAVDKLLGVTSSEPAQSNSIANDVFETVNDTSILPPIVERIDTK